MRETGPFPLICGLAIAGYPALPPTDSTDTLALVRLRRMEDIKNQLDGIFEATPEGLDVERLETFLDGLPPSARITAVRLIGGRRQMKLWDACESRGSTLESFVTAATSPNVEVVNAGKNSLPVFTEFEKRFVRPTGREDVLYGYNEGMTRALVGPGYFVAHYFEERGEVGIDYLNVPPQNTQLPDGWPAIKTNESGLQKFVYAGMIDYMRRVSEHVTVGRATKGGKDTPHTFLLCRCDPKPH
jgi:hypothetical protein